MTLSTLVVDIGGTNTRVALARDTRVDRDTIQRFRNADESGLVPVLQAYLANTGIKPDAVCVDAAGPVKDGVLEMTNLDWEINAERLKVECGVNHVSLLNDLQAHGHAAPNLPESSLLKLADGKPSSKGAASLIVNIGTGMNIAPVYPTPKQTVVPPAEAGHMMLPAQTETERALVTFLEARTGFASIEEALSGRGFEAVYAFVSGKERKAPEIMGALDSDPQVAETLSIFIGLAGRIAGDFALVHLPFGGVYLVGGVIQHMAPHLERFGFAETFREKGRFSDYMEQFPIHAVCDDYAALTGCAVHMCEVVDAAS